MSAGLLEILQLFFITFSYNYKQISGSCHHHQRYNYILNMLNRQIYIDLREMSAKNLGRSRKDLIKTYPVIVCRHSKRRKNEYNVRPSHCEGAAREYPTYFVSHFITIGDLFIFINYRGVTPNASISLRLGIEQSETSR